MYWAAAADTAAAEPHAMGPNSTSLHGHQTKDLYDMEVPGHQIRNFSRWCAESVACFSTSRWLHTLRKTQRHGWNELVRRSAMPLAHREHTVVRSANGEPVAPVALYVGAVPFSHMRMPWCALDLIFRVAVWSPRVCAAMRY